MDQPVGAVSGVAVASLPTGTTGRASAVVALMGVGASVVAVPPAAAGAIVAAVTALPELGLVFERPTTLRTAAGAADATFLTPLTTRATAPFDALRVALVAPPARVAVERAAGAARVVRFADAPPRAALFFAVLPARLARLLRAERFALADRLVPARRVLVLFFPRPVRDVERRAFFFAMLHPP